MYHASCSGGSGLCSVAVSAVIPMYPMWKSCRIVFASTTGDVLVKSFLTCPLHRVGGETMEGCTTHLCPVKQRSDRA